ncbi:MAG: glycogen/starch synthase, partial [Bacteroidales bacterium]|nr:glycogen/starch synthase [Bacteroidales bacterium]
ETVKKLRWTPDVIHCQGWMAGIIPLYIRQAYNDEPCFSDAKIVTSLYSRNMDGIMGENVKDCIAYKDINRETLAAYDDAFTMADMERLAVDYSDGIIEMTEGYNPEIIQYAKEKGKAVLAYPGESFVEKYREFYESL